MSILISCLIFTQKCHFSGDDDCPSTKINPLGCYDERSIGLFNKALSSSENNTILDCTGRCREEGFQYAAMLNGTGCSCGNLQPLGPHRRPTTQCNVDCPGEPSEKCGGAANRIDAYYVEPFGEKVLFTFGVNTKLGCYKQT